MSQKYAFLDRDGTLIYEPKNEGQIDSLSKLKILDGVIENLKKLMDSGYKLVMVTNQDGLGTKSFPQNDFDKPQARLLGILKNEGINFAYIFICPHFENDNCKCRKPKTGLLNKFLKTEKIDFKNSFMCGDRETDRQFAKNLGVRYIPMEGNGTFNPFNYLPRTADIYRKTAETIVKVNLNLDGTGVYKIDTGLGFLNHMLELFAKHSLIDLKIRAKGDLKVDEHHTVEDVGIALGSALAEAMGDKRGIERYGFLLPMDEALAEVAIDLSGRPLLKWGVKFTREKIGDVPTELFEEFFRALTDNLKATVHINMRYGKNEHHLIESIFKAFARALKSAIVRDERNLNLLPSTKGKL